MAAGLGPDDHAIVSAVTFLATANAVRYVDAEVLFADAYPNNGLSTEDHFQAVIDAHPDQKIRAMFPVHLCGQTTDMEALSALATTHKLMIIEDASHALGTTYKTSDGHEYAVGGCAHSDMAAFSFHPSKTIAMGEGGAVTTNDESLFEKLRLYRNHGMDLAPSNFVNRALAEAADGTANPWYYEMQTPGYNYRPSDIHCALAHSQLKKLDTFKARRRDLAVLYSRLLAPLAPNVTPLAWVENIEPILHLYPVLIDFDAIGLDRASVMAKLRDLGIGTQVHYLPVNQQPYYRERYGESDLPGAEKYYDRVLALPFYPALTDEDVERVVVALTEIVA
jgi:dTDP-4-amino-4,6-dideoxygalactose transaminase